MGLLVYPETTVRNYHYSLRNNPAECSSHLLRGGRLKPSTQTSYFVIPVMNVQLKILVTTRDEPVKVSNEETLISSSLHYNKCMVRPVANLTLYITQRDMIIGFSVQ
jgi:hypothetical protein